MSRIRGLYQCSFLSRVVAHQTSYLPKTFPKYKHQWTLAHHRCMQLPDKTRTILVASSRNYSTDDSRAEREYDETVNETLFSLADMFEDIAETLDVDPDYDVAFENGVLTVVINKTWGTYVINKQTPNRQIWFSSPISGPKRYDFIDKRWVYSHDGMTLHELLTKEISEAFKTNLNFKDCAYGR